MKKYFKKQISILLTVLLLFLYIVYPVSTIAQVVTPTDTPTPTATTIDNTAGTTNTATITSDTGNNAINPTPTPTDTPTPSVDTPTPTPTIDPSLSPFPTPDLSQTSIATDSATSDGSLNPPIQGVNTNNTNPSPSNTTNPTINTGNATSITNLINDVNSTNVNAQVINQTINLFVDQNGNLNVSDPFNIASAAIQSHPNDPIINVSVTNVNNFAYLSNNIVSGANTGENSINGSSAIINTGNAYSIVNLINKVNFTVMNSNLHLVTINIFGNLNGNIILPNLPPNTSTNCSGCGVNTVVNNSTQVTNNIQNTSNTGTNSITGGASSSIVTGNSTSSTNNINLINTNIFGTNAEMLFLNNFGVWTGSFIGWDSFAPQLGGTNLSLINLTPSATNSATTCSSCTGNININNNANVTNNITSSANTGTNSINGKNASITTGNAFSAISLFNLINTNFINSSGFFGLINIFGNWTGNIGGANEFAALNAPPPAQDQTTQQESVSNNSNSNTNNKEDGGKLELTNRNNVGAFVYPGDTVTFFIKVRNTGTGKVYGTKIDLYLYKNGQENGGTTFNIGDIDAGKSKTLTTGFVLSKNAQNGPYTAEAYSYGTTGNNNTSVDAYGESYFNIVGATSGTNINNQQSIHPVVSSVLGTNSNTINKSVFVKKAEEMLYISLLMLVIFAYISIRLVKKKEFVMAIINSKTFKERLYSLRMFLL